jgi:MoxR-like ATPase
MIHGKMPDEQLDRLLDRIPVKTPDDDTAARIVQHATAMKQRRGVRLLAATIVSRLTSPWPDDLVPKVTALAMVMLITFAAGLNQEAARTHGPDIMSLATGNVDEGDLL